jgi:hypothetical protein
MGWDVRGFPGGIISFMTNSRALTAENMAKQLKEASYVGWGREGWKESSNVTGAVTTGRGQW